MNHFIMWSDAAIKIMFMEILWHGKNFGFLSEKLKDAKVYIYDMTTMTYKE